MSKNDGFDLCDYCCDWANKHRDTNPFKVRDDYPKMMRKVLKSLFHMSKKAADTFIEDACYGNWKKIHETDVEQSTDEQTYANLLVSDVFYCSDRWSWDRVIRIQWLYKRLENRCWHIEERR